MSPTPFRCVSLCVRCSFQWRRPRSLVGHRFNTITVYGVRASKIKASSIEEDVAQTQAKLTELLRLQAELSEVKEAQPAAPVLDEPAAQAIQPAADAVQAMQEPAVTALQDVSTATQELSTAFVPFGEVSPLLTVLVLSVAPLVLSVVYVAVGAASGEGVKPWSFKGRQAAAFIPTNTNTADGGQRDAKEIFATGLDSLKKQPLGWLFGPPSALYSNLPTTGVPSGRASVRPEEREAQKLPAVSSSSGLPSSPPADLDVWTAPSPLGPTPTEPPATPAAPSPPTIPAPAAPAVLERVPETSMAANRFEKRQKRKKKRGMKKP